MKRAMVFALVLLAAACGGGTSSAPATSAGLTQAKAAVARYSQAPTTADLLPGATALPSRPPAGKVVDFIQCPFAVCELEGALISQAGAALGWKINILKEKDQTPPTVTALWDTIVQSPPDAVLTTDGVPVQLFQSQVQAAQAKGTVFSGGAIDPTPPYTLATTAGSTDFALRGKLLADWIVADTNGKPQTVVWSIPQVPVVTAETDALKKEYQSTCSGCAFDLQLVPPTDIGKNLPGEVTAYLQAHPNTNYVAFAFGDMLPGVTTALKAAGYTPDKIKIAAGAGDTINFEEIKNHDFEVVSVSEDLGITSYRLLDSLARLWTGGNKDDILKLESGTQPYHFIAASQVTDPSQPYRVLAPAVEMNYFYQLWHVA